MNDVSHKYGAAYTFTPYSIAADETILDFPPITTVRLSSSSFEPIKYILKESAKIAASRMRSM